MYGSVRLAAVALMTVLLSGCATNVGNPSTDDFGRYLSLQSGVTKKLDVYSNFGQPARVKYLPGDSGSIWTYVYVKASVSGATFVPFIGLFAGGTNTDSRAATFYFDSHDTFTKVETQSLAKYTNQWVGLSKGASAMSADQSYDEVRNEMLKYDLPFDWKMAKKLRGIEAYVE